MAKVAIIYGQKKKLKSLLLVARAIRVKNVKRSIPSIKLSELII